MGISCSRACWCVCVLNKEEIIYANIDLDKLNQRRKISEAVWQPAEVPKFKVKKEEKGGDFTEIWSYKKFRKY